MCLYTNDYIYIYVYKNKNFKLCFVFLVRNCFVDKIFLGEMKRGDYWIFYMLCVLKVIMFLEEIDCGV